METKNKIHRLSLDVTPTAKGRPRFTRTGRSYTPKKTADAEALIKEIVGYQWKEGQLEGALSVTIEFWMPIPKSWSEKKKREYEGVPHISRPDLDNMTKLILDSLNEICWKDDSQIAELSLLKAYLAKPGITISIQQMQKNPPN